MNNEFDDNIDSGLGKMRNFPKGSHPKTGMDAPGMTSDITDYSDPNYWAQERARAEHQMQHKTNMARNHWMRANPGFVTLPNGNMVSSIRGLGRIAPPNPVRQHVQKTNAEPGSDEMPMFDGGHELPNSNESYDDADVSCLLPSYNEPAPVKNLVRLPPPSMALPGVEQGLRGFAAIAPANPVPPPPDYLKSIIGVIGVAGLLFLCFGKGGKQK